MGWVALAGVVAAIAAWLVDRRRRAYADRPTTPAAAVFAGRNEVKGRAWAAGPLTAHRSKTPTVWWEYVLEEERTHTRTVTTTDAQGRSQSRTETYQQWHEIDRRGDTLATFDVVDNTGSVPVRLQGANVIARHLHGDTFRRDGDDDRGFLAKMFDSSTGRYRETERGVAIGDRLFVVGDAHLDETTCVPVLRDDVLVSTRSEESHTTWLAVAVVVLVLAAGAAALVAGRLIGLGVALVVFVAAWAFTTYNRLRLVAQGAEQAKSLVDVQLQRRHDLIPALATAVAAHAGHERGVLVAAADAAGQTAQLRELLALAEQHPQLTADESFLRLQRGLADTETRIAASRAFYDDSVELLRTRSRSFPGLLVARRLRLGDPRLAAAEGFERTVPAIEHGFR